MTGDEVTTIRTALGMTNEEFGERLDISVRTVSKLQNSGVVIEKIYEYAIRAMLFNVDRKELSLPDSGTAEKSFKEYLGARYQKELKTIRKDQAYLRETVLEMPALDLARLQGFINAGDACGLGFALLEMHMNYTGKVAENRVQAMAED